MKIIIAAVGKMKSGPEAALVKRYTERVAPLTRQIGVSQVQMIEIIESRQPRVLDRQSEEGRLLLARIEPATIIAWDERGISMTSPAFAARMGRYREDGVSSLAFIIGGPDGLDDAVRAKADLVLSFGAFTVPHQLVRGLVMEQLYRALTILSGHPYHRD